MRLLIETAAAHGAGAGPFQETALHPTNPAARALNSFIKLFSPTPDASPSEKAPLPPPQAEETHESSAVPMIPDEDVGYRVARAQRDYVEAPNQIEINNAILAAETLAKRLPKDHDRIKDLTSIRNTDQGLRDSVDELAKIYEARAGKTLTQGPEWGSRRSGLHQKILLVVSNSPTPLNRERLRSMVMLIGDIARLPNLDASNKVSVKRIQGDLDSIMSYDQKQQLAATIPSTFLKVALLTDYLPAKRMQTPLSAESLAQWRARSNEAKAALSKAANMEEVDAAAMLALQVAGEMPSDSRDLGMEASISALNHAAFWHQAVSTTSKNVDRLVIYIEIGNDIERSKFELQSFKSPNESFQFVGRHEPPPTWVNTNHMTRMLDVLKNLAALDLNRGEKEFVNRGYRSLEVLSPRLQLDLLKHDPENFLATVPFSGPVTVGRTLTTLLDLQQRLPADETSEESRKDLGCNLKILRLCIEWGEGADAVSTAKQLADIHPESLFITNQLLQNLRVGLGVELNLGVTGHPDEAKAREGWANLVGGFPTAAATLQSRILDGGIAGMDVLKVFDKHGLSLAGISKTIPPVLDFLVKNKSAFIEGLKTRMQDLLPDPGGFADSMWANLCAQLDATMTVGNLFMQFDDKEANADVAEILGKIATLDTTAVLLLLPHHVLSDFASRMSVRLGASNEHSRAHLALSPEMVHKNELANLGRTRLEGWLNPQPVLV